MSGSQKEAKESTEPEQSKIDTKVPYLIRESVDELKPDYEIAKCCKPIPGDEVVGYIASDDKIIIHKPKCPVAVRLMSSEGNRLIEVKWTIHKMVSFLAQIHLEGIDRIGVVSDITNIISRELSVNMRNITITVNDGIFEGTIDVYVHHTKDLNNLIMKLVNIEGVDRVKRVETFN
jgi:GTP pyrophosphokinase